MTYKIEKGVELSLTECGRPHKYPWADMEVGDSFEFEGDGAKRSNVVTSGRAWGQRRNGEEFTARKISDGIYRCWRIK